MIILPAEDSGIRYELLLRLLSSALYLLHLVHPYVCCIHFARKFDGTIMGTGRRFIP